MVVFISGKVTYRRKEEHWYVDYLVDLGNIVVGSVFEDCIRRCIEDDLLSSVRREDGYYYTTIFL